MRRYSYSSSHAGVANIWMKQHGRELAMQMSAVGRSVLEGNKPLRLLAVVVGLALLREGSEVLLFLYGIASIQKTGSSAMLSGGLLGIAAGAALGYLLYRGLLKIPSKHLFTVTSWLILLLAAGISAHGAAYLVQVDLLPPLGRAIWDTSDFIPEQSISGQSSEHWQGMWNVRMEFRYFSISPPSRSMAQ